MTHLYRARGVVLRTAKLGEADRIISFCTRERGKVRAVAKGVRKTKSKFGGRLEPLRHVSLQCYEGRELDIVTQVETIDAYRNIHDDFDRLRRALAMVEAVDTMSQEGHENPSLYNVLTKGLHRLDVADSPVIVGAFYWRLLALDGMHPILDRCAICGTNSDLTHFGLTYGGVSCRSCRRGSPLLPATLNLLRQTLGGDLARVLRNANGTIAHEYEQLADDAMEHHLERRIRTRHLLHQV